MGKKMNQNFLILGNVNIIDVNYTDWILMII